MDKTATLIIIFEPSDKEGIAIIELTKLNGKEIMINEDYIQHVEETPDTVVTYRDGKKLVVKESKDEIKQLIIDYKKKLQ